MSQLVFRCLFATRSNLKQSTCLDGGDNNSHVFTVLFSEALGNQFETIRSQANFLKCQELVTQERHRNYRATSGGAPGSLFRILLESMPVLLVGSVF